MTKPPAYVDFCRICRRWHGEHDSACIKTHIRRFGSLIVKLWDRGIIIGEWLFALYLRVAAVGLIALFAWLIWLQYSPPH